MPTGQALGLLAIGGVALAAGVLVYLTDRPGSHPLWIPAFRFLSGAPWFGAIGQWLPSLVHPFAFSLFSAALLPPRRRWHYGACAFWLGVNAAFEIGQHPQVRAPLAAALRSAFGEGRIAGAVENYFLRGTFDVGDLAAAATGAALAAVILLRLQLHREAHHVP
jgi:hypothetical protein